MIANGELKITMFFALLLSLQLGVFSNTARAEGFQGGLQEAFGPLFKEGSTKKVQPGSHAHPVNSVERLRYWNQVAIDSSGLDHTPVSDGENRVFGEQLGPTRSSRAMAIVHIAMFEVVNAVKPKYQSYIGLPPASANTLVDAAIAQAAHDTLVALFPSQAPRLDTLLADDLSRMPGGKGLPKSNGIQLGKDAASAILALRTGDESHYAEPIMGVEYITSDDPGRWQQDPIGQIPIALGAYWGKVKPFVLASSDQFRVSPPPNLNSPEYAIAYEEAKRLGGDGVITPTERTEEQTLIGIYWAYDGTPSLCAPPRLYNQIVRLIAAQMGTEDLTELARLFAMVNVALADAGIAIWESKYYYDFWRPVTAIRATITTPGSSIIGDLTFTPLGSPASNLSGPNFTPPFPTYPSGHAGFGAALFQILRNYYGTDQIAFTFVSDELNGLTTDNEGNVRPLIPRSFTSLSEAEEENGQSRIYLGIHWAFDKTSGLAQGRQVADYVYARLFKPLP